MTTSNLQDPNPYQDFPTADELNTINGYFTIGRSTQSFDMNTFRSIASLLGIIRQISGQSEIKNIFFLDRGYDDASELFREWFGTQKRSARCVNIEPGPNRPQRFKNQIVIQPSGCQVVHVTRVIIDGKKQLQTALCVSGTTTYLTQLDRDDTFGQRLLGRWIGIKNRPFALTSSLPLCPSSIIPPGAKYILQGKKRMLFGILSEHHC